MKGIYWRPRKVSQAAIGVIGLISVAGIIAVEVFKTRLEQPYHEEKLAASRLAERCMEVVRDERIRRGHPIDPELDPAGTGLIGPAMTPITTMAGHLDSKQASTNPNFAAAVVQMLREAGVRKGDQMAIGYSGSFPAANIAVLAAVETLQLLPIIVASAASSQYGANLPDFLWIDMERLLVDKGLISCRSQAVSVGGRGDCGMGMSDDARRLIRDAIDRNGLPLLEAGNFAESVRTRMDIYDRHAGMTPVRAYINVGGGAVSVGEAVSVAVSVAVAVSVSVSAAVTVSVAVAESVAVSVTVSAAVTVSESVAASESVAESVAVAVSVAVAASELALSPVS